MKPFEIMVFDLDGTLLTRDFQLLEETKQAFFRIRDRHQLRMTIATGRGFPSARPYLEALEISEPVVFSNGSVYDDPETGFREVLAGVPLETALICLMLLDQYQLSAKAFLAGGQILKSHAIRWPEEGTHFDPGQVCANIKAELKEDPIKMVFHGQPEQMAAFRQRLEGLLGQRSEVRMFRSHPAYVEMTARSVSKGDGLAVLLSKMGLEPAQVIAVGDQENDLEMLKLAGMAVQVGDACPALAEHAQHQIPLPEEGGIQALEKLLQGLLPHG